MEVSAFADPGKRRVHARPGLYGGDCAGAEGISRGRLEVESAGSVGMLGIFDSTLRSEQPRIYLGSVFGSVRRGDVIARMFLKYFCTRGAIAGWTRVTIKDVIMDYMALGQ